MTAVKARKTIKRSLVKAEA